MKFQDQVIESTADLRARAAAFADSAVTRARAVLTSARVDSVKASLDALQLAGREFNKVARRHVSRFVKENSVIARDAGKEVTALARSTYSSLAKQAASPARKSAGKTSAARKRAAGTRRRAAVKAA
ncbi:MAG: hypothetical protein K0Q92_313 [Steroidobacteraceae bacterium]|jgi:hypothetical protein|nr:hypothetical protein [Steroidobacteraceae bacterium]